MMKIAIVTGASSGLGYEMIRQLDGRTDIQEFWLIARRKERLEAIAGLIHTKVRIFTWDLSERGSIDELEKTLKTEKPLVKLLINAAGFGKIGNYSEISRQDCDRMIDLNCRAAVDITQAVIPYMKGGSHIMEVCSSSAYMPVPYLNVYAATKVFLLHYSRALRKELLPQGILVTAVCPYWIRDTEFIAKAQKSENSSYIRHFPMATWSRDVAAGAIRDTYYGHAVSTPGLFCTLQRIFSRFFATDALLEMWELIRRL
jgi:short-subunit dehydrogenase